MYVDYNLNMNDYQPTTKQIAVFTVVLSFIVSIIGTILSLGVFGPLLGVGENIAGPVLFNRPGILERIKETVVQDTTSERIERQDELVVKVVAEASPSVVSVVATKDVPVVEKFFTDPFGNDPFFREFFFKRGCSENFKFHFFIS